MARILIVDDEENIRGSLKSALDKRGHECVTAESFAQGQQFARVEFDLILLDVMLGDGSGLDLLGEIMTRRPDSCRYPTSVDLVAVAVWGRNSFIVTWLGSR